MAKYLTAIGASIVAVYLLTAFVGMEFDPTEWAKADRAGAVFGAIFMSACACLLVRFVGEEKT